MVLVLTSAQRCTDPSSIVAAEAMSSYGLPLTVHVVPPVPAPSARAHVIVGALGTARAGRGSRLAGTGGDWAALLVTRNCMSGVTCEPMPVALWSVRATLSSTTFLPTGPAKSTTTSARSAGPSRMSLRVTGLGSSDDPFP